MLQTKRGKKRNIPLILKGQLIEEIQLQRNNKSITRIGKSFGFTKQTTHSIWKNRVRILERLVSKPETNEMVNYDLKNII